MSACIFRFALLVGSLAVATHAQDSQVLVRHLANEAAQAGFVFSDIASPSPSDAGNAAKLSLLAGQVDGNSGSVLSLIDGQLPTEADQPSRNFFLGGSGGGRVLFDFGKDIEVRQVRTYSWHPHRRGPQVYALYAASESSTAELKLERDADPAASRWTLVAEVDTRLDAVVQGGQYAALIQSSNENVALGNYRYLLFDIRPTAAQGRDSQTFFSEIDIDDGQAHEPAIPDTLVDTLIIGNDQYRIHFDTTEAPDLRGWVNTSLMPICKEWYPRIVEMLPSEDYQAPSEFKIVFKDPMDGVAFASGTQITAAAPWYRGELEREAIGSIVHEMVHIVQQYPRRRGNRNPSWLVEGVADYIRWFLFEPSENSPKVNFARASYDDSYRTSAAFINYAVENYDPQLVTKLNAAMRDGAYSLESWREITGKSPIEIWQEFKAQAAQ